MHEVSPIQESWSIKRILVGVFIIAVLVGIGYGIKVFAFDFGKNPAKSNNSTKQNTPWDRVEGVSSQNNQDGQSFSLPAQLDVQDRINTIRREVTNLNISEIASSSPQVQKVLEDIKSLEQYPKNQAKDLCQKICNGF